MFDRNGLVMHISHSKHSTVTCVCDYVHNRCLECQQSCCLVQIFGQLSYLINLLFVIIIIISPMCVRCGQLILINLILRYVES